MLHGAGSTPEFVQRAFGPAARRAGCDLVAPDVAGLDMAAMVEVIAAARPAAVGGVSLGAHAAVLFAVRHHWAGPLYAVMPAWVGRPESVAALTAHTAREIRTGSVGAVLERIDAEAGADWIAEELRRAWSGMPGDELVRALDVASRQPAPGAGELAQVRGPATIVGLADDPTHPLAVAHLWAQSIPRADLHVLPRDLDGQGPQALATWLPELAVSGSR